MSPCHINTHIHTHVRSHMPYRWPSPMSRTSNLFPGLSSRGKQELEFSWQVLWRQPDLSPNPSPTLYTVCHPDNVLQSARLENGQNSHQWSCFHCYIYSAHYNCPINVSHLPFPFPSWWRLWQRERTSGLCSCTVTPFCGAHLTLMLKVFLWPLYCLPKSRLQQHSIFCQREDYFKHLGSEKEGQLQSPELAQTQLTTQRKAAHRETVDSLHLRPRPALWDVLTL